MRTASARTNVQSLRVSLRFAIRLNDERAQAEIKGRHTGFGILKEWGALKSWLREKGAELSPEDYVDALSAELAVAEPFEARAQSKRKVAKKVEHPSLYLKRFMAAKGLTTERFQTLMNLDPNLLEDFMAAKIPVNSDLAAALSRVVGNDQGFWLDYGNDK